MSDESLRQASRLLDLLSDRDRLRMIGRLVEVEWTVTELAEALGLKPQAVVRHVRSLEDAGLIQRRSEDSPWFSFDTEQLQLQVAAVRPESLQAFDGETEEDARILGSYIVAGRLSRLPSQRSRWLVVLRWLVNTFQFEIDYPEREVNEKLLEYHEDYALLRRQLVDEGLMTRDHGVYRRVGEPPRKL